MRRLANATGEMPKYTYMSLPTGEADVFIYKPTDEEDIYEFNEFRTKTLKESDIEKDPYRYLDYEESEQTLEEKVKDLEKQNEFLTECLIEIGNIIYA